MQENKHTEAKLQEFGIEIANKLADVEKQVNLLSDIRSRRKERFQDTNTGFGESSNSAQQSSKNKASVRRLKTRHKELKRAQLRIENGTYGICVKTGNLISEARLKAMPTARVCMKMRTDHK